jgi:sugar phosphate isomerase/epimerase
LALKERIGLDVGATRLEDVLGAAAARGVKHLDFSADVGPNRLDGWPEDRVRVVRETCDRNGVLLGLHTQSAINVAEYSPVVSDAVDQYLLSNIDLAVRLGCRWVIVHGGYHFSSSLEARKQASLERLKRSVEYAEGVGALLILENLNFEPDDAEVHYLAHSVEECRLYFDAIQSDHFGWAFTANHAHLVPEDIDGFLDAFGIGRIWEVRLADNWGVKEEHLIPGEGNIDFDALFRRLESSRYQRFYTLAFGSMEDKLASREELARFP